MTVIDQQRLLWKCSWMANGRAPSAEDVHYWIDEGKLQECLDRGEEIHDDRYAEKRLLGWRASGMDTPRYGEYAIPPTPYHDVPPYPGDEAPPAPSRDPVAQVLGLLEKQVSAQRDLLDATQALYLAVLAATKR